MIRRRRRLRVGDTARIHTRGLLGIGLADGHAVVIPRGATGVIVGCWADQHVSVSPLLPPQLCLRVTVAGEQADVPVDSDMAGVVTPVSPRRRRWVPHLGRATGVGAITTAGIWVAALLTWGAVPADQTPVMSPHPTHVVETGEGS